MEQKSTPDFRKQGQLKIAETIFIMIIFFILLAIGLIFYSSVEANSLSKTRDIDAQRETFKSALAISYLPELSCTNLRGELEEGCFDKYKLSAFSSYMAGADPDMKRKMLFYYFDLFGDSTIKVVSIFPGWSQEYWIFNRTLPNYRSVSTTFVPVVLRDPVSEYDSFAYLEISTYR